MNAQVEDDPDADEKENKPILEFNSADYKGFSVGVNFGVYFANKSSATFYTGNNFYTPNDICVYLPCGSSSGNPIIYNRIFDAIGGYDFTLESFGDDLRYDPGLVLGANLRYQMGTYWSLQTDLNYSNLTAKGVIVLLVDRPNTNGTSDDYFESHPIWGKEQRLVISPGAQFNLSDPGQVVPYFDLGAILTSTRVKENKFRIQTLEYNILRPQLVNGQFINNKQQTTNGLGFFGGLGMNIEFDKVIFDFGYRASFEKVPFRKFDENLIQHDKRKLHHSITLKFLYGK